MTPEKIVTTKISTQVDPFGFYSRRSSRPTLTENTYTVSWEVDTSIPMISDSFRFGQNDQHKAHIELIPGEEEDEYSDYYHYHSDYDGETYKTRHYIYPHATLHFVFATSLHGISPGKISLTQMVDDVKNNTVKQKFCSNSNRVLTFYLKEVKIKSDGGYNSQQAVLKTINKYKILCEIRLEEYIERSTYETHNSEMINYITNLYTSKSFSDVTFHVENQQIPAHRNILAARSPVFAAMFSTDMAEKEGVINVNDITYKAMNDLIKYIYTGEVCMMTSAEALLPAADKYGLTSLKFECGMYLARHNISVNNAISLAVLADRHQHEHLRKTAVKFFRKHKSEVLETKVWKRLKKSNPTLLLEVLTEK